MANINPLPFRISDHAREQMNKRGMSRDLLLRILTRPEIVEPHMDRFRFVRDGLYVAVAPEGRTWVVVTIGLRHGENWTDDDVREHIRRLGH